LAICVCNAAGGTLGTAELDCRVADVCNAASSNSEGVPLLERARELAGRHSSPSIAGCGSTATNWPTDLETRRCSVFLELPIKTETAATVISSPMANRLLLLFFLTLNAILVTKISFSVFGAQQTKMRGPPGIAVQASAAAKDGLLHVSIHRIATQRPT
jgi:hypothetical protein